ncbi:Hypothetical protein ADU72_0708 [Pediococcus damnosus]|uniref:Uncharacterized protein n=1 Tax=Pediococcus damnosus TaxID=51663 RepID=A0ABM6A2Z8_9LACO|nr:Hypothetical protein ADU69_1193 [Pediococcus damnosus]AMV65162.1 Hypothetical protein ADU71_1266 [Pediococcus damnosus]AMV66653.1 Hypothetical protein ADU72_0708 [Pediococcus damnosus]AMV68935.1 Hypothetical protein ADU73_0527 [Pediococcus damnosus]
MVVSSINRRAFLGYLNKTILESEANVMFVFGFLFLWIDSTQNS